MLSVASGRCGEAEGQWPDFCHENVAQVGDAQEGRGQCCVWGNSGWLQASGTCRGSGRAWLPNRKRIHPQQRVFLLSLPHNKPLEQAELFPFSSLFFFFFWPRWVFVAARGLSLVAANRGHSSLWCAGFSFWWLLSLWSTGSRRVGFSSCGTRASVVVARGLRSTGSVVVTHGLSCSTACGIFPDQGSNPCALHRQVDS